MRGVFGANGDRKQMTEMGEDEADNYAGTTTRELCSCAEKPRLHLI